MEEGHDGHIMNFLFAYKWKAQQSLEDFRAESRGKSNLAYDTELQHFWS